MKLWDEWFNDLGLEDLLKLCSVNYGDIEDHNEFIDQADEEWDKLNDSEKQKIWHDFNNEI